ncbi:MAG: type II toxin-antitoxin system Phd/YefM family antitoxin [Nitrospirae bacterium]|nr:type II toxin-antitoxin system Phd/YefM family antitoxin [Magnetococcales bacterium]HAT51533.1 prevent-host-death family protein [Alphaproteobacteria bacterium]
MTVLLEMIPVSDLRQNAATTLERLERSRNPIVITQRGHAAAVLMSVKSYEHSEEERQLLLRLLKSEEEIQKGEGHGLEDVMAQSRALLESKLE